MNTRKLRHESATLNEMIRVAVEYGIFTNPTREGFDAAYSSNKVKESVMYAAMSSVMITDEAIEKEAQQ
jgi:hypothetical protein